MSPRRNLLPLTLMTSMVLVACQKAPQSTTTLVEGYNQAVNCKAGGNTVDTEGLEIQGHAKAMAGEAVHYQLNQDLSCSGTQTVVWKTVAVDGSTQVGSQMNSSFAKAGDYIVSAQVLSSDSVVPHELAFKTVVVSGDPALSGPQVSMVGVSNTFDLVVPSSMDVTSADWTFGDSSAGQNSLGPVSHTYSRPGAYTVQVILSEANGNKTTLTHSVNVISLQDGLECVNQLSISGESEVVVNTPVTLSAFIPSCVASRVTAVSWNFGDATSGASNQTVQHTYTSLGTYTVTAQLFTGSTSAPWVTLSHQIRVKEEIVIPTPTPTPIPDPDPTPTPLLHECPAAGQTRETRSDLYSENMTCGTDGTKVMSYRDVLVEECAPQTGGVLKWTESSRRKELQSEGECQGQSCVGFGSHGTVKTGVVTGEVQVPLTCAFGEQGFFNTFHEVSDQACQNGNVVTSNPRQGDLKTAGQCPTYNYGPTDKWTTCSADCGGQQTRLFQCQNASGEAVESSRCEGSAPIESRLCDGNPAAVAREESSTSIEEAGASNLCPANQIGVIINKREVTVVSKYACVEHQVSLASSETVYGPWISENYCRDYVPKRCSHDSLSNTEAMGRYKWMVKCQDQVPVIKEFLAKFDDVSVANKKQQFGISDGNRFLYPTFMNRIGTTEKAWIAPKTESGSCNVPSTVYVAAVCVSSCATPEQQILAEAASEKSLKYISYIEALTKNVARVATLASGSSLSSKAVRRTAVDNWVTELVDTDHEILVFRMKSGRELRVTPNHPLLATDATMKEAQQFRVGDALVALGGVRDGIISIRKVVHTGKVYNLFVKSADLHENIVVTNGYLNGTAFFQNEGAQNMNRALFRQKLTRGAFEK